MQTNLINQLIQIAGGVNALARITDISRTQIARWRDGVTSMPLNSLIDMCQKMNLQVDVKIIQK